MIEREIWREKQMTREKWKKMKKYLSLNEMKKLF